MATITRKADKKGRITLFDDFADAFVVVERVGTNELRIRKVVTNPRRITLADILARIPEGIEDHDIIDFGPAQGEEVE